MKTPRKHAELIKAWADGADIQVQYFAHQGWIDMPDPSWDARYKYRIKPKPDVVKFANIYKDCVGFFHRTLDEANREADPESIGVLKITINGETSNVSVEVV